MRVIKLNYLYFILRFNTVTDDLVDRFNYVFSIARYAYLFVSTVCMTLFLTVCMGAMVGLNVHGILRGICVHSMRSIYSLPRGLYI